MRTRSIAILLAALGAVAGAIAVDATELLTTALAAADIAASPPSAVAVSIYRAPYRNGGTLDLNALGGFALITETRTVHLPAGTTRLRFEGVVGGIRSESAIVTGLPDGVIEKNRDAAVLSPAALLQAAVNTDVTLVRTNRRTGMTSRVPATIRSASPDGVVFATAAGVEALRCSGLPETFAFSRIPAWLSSVPTLSVTTHAPRAVTATVTLSYLADGFDWSADYTAKVAPNGRTLDLSAWITLANGNGESLKAAATQIIAGRLNRVDSAVEPVAVPTVLARCWPQGTTSDTVDQPDIVMVSPFGIATAADAIMVTAMRRKAPMAMMQNPPAPAAPPPPEQLGDLKLYRVPYPTTVASRQAKQTRLLDQHGVAFDRVYVANINPIGNLPAIAARSVLRFTNTAANHLGLPLPSGHVALFQTIGARTGFAGGADLRDTAEGETFDLDVGAAADVQVEQTWLVGASGAVERRDLTAEITAAWTVGTKLERVAISNATSRPVAFELRLRKYDESRVVAATLPVGMKDGRPIFRMTLPANGSISFDYVIK